MEIFIQYIILSRFLNRLRFIKNIYLELVEFIDLGILDFISVLRIKGFRLKVCFS